VLGGVAPRTAVLLILTLTRASNVRVQEVIRQTGHGKKADIWSVGCTVIQVLDLAVCMCLLAL
jgi:hypothetical protein